MITSTISNTKNHLSELLAEVRTGETLVILDRKTPVAKVERICHLVDNPHVQPPAKEWCPADVLDLPIGIAPTVRNTLTSAVLEERADGW